MLGLLDLSERVKVTTEGEIRGNGCMSPDKTKKPRVLVLDTATYQKLFDTILGDDYELLATDEPGEAILIASTESPELILLNHTINKTDGLSVAKEIRETVLSVAPMLLTCAYRSVSSTEECPNQSRTRSRSSG